MLGLKAHGGVKKFVLVRLSYRATRADETSSTVVVHYLTDGTATVSIRIRKQEFLVPAVLWLRALSSRNETDEVLYRRITAGSASSYNSSTGGGGSSGGMNVQEAFLRPRVELLFRESAHLGLATSDEALQFLGERFRSVFTSELAVSTSNSAVGRCLMDRYLFIHLSNDQDKLNCLCLGYGYEKGWKSQNEKWKEIEKEQRRLEKTKKQGKENRKEIVGRRR